MSRFVCRLCELLGHDWLYRRVNANRRYCRRCGVCQYLAGHWTRDGVTHAMWEYEYPVLKAEHDARDANPPRQNAV